MSSGWSEGNNKCKRNGTLSIDDYNVLVALLGLRCTVSLIHADEDKVLTIIKIYPILRELYSVEWEAKKGDCAEKGKALSDIEVKASDFLRILIEQIDNEIVKSRCWNCLTEIRDFLTKGGDIKEKKSSRRSVKVQEYRLERVVKCH